MTKYRMKSCFFWGGLGEESVNTDFLDHHGTDVWADGAHGFLQFCFDSHQVHFCSTKPTAQSLLPICIPGIRKILYQQENLRLGFISILVILTYRNRYYKNGIASSSRKTKGKWNPSKQQKLWQPPYYSTVLAADGSFHILLYQQYITCYYY